MTVREGPRTDVRFVGDSWHFDFSPGDRVTFADAKNVTADEVERSAAAIRAEYQQRGYHFATVKAHFKASRTRLRPRVCSFRVTGCVIRHTMRTR